MPKTDFSSQMCVQDCRFSLPKLMIIIVKTRLFKKKVDIVIMVMGIESILNPNLKAKTVPWPVDMLKGINLYLEKLKFTPDNCSKPIKIYLSIVKLTSIVSYFCKVIYLQVKIKHGALPIGEDLNLESIINIYAHHDLYVILEIN
jgi:hypothetical protein